jgi:hypothetical protein
MITVAISLLMVRIGVVAVLIALSAVGVRASSADAASMCPNIKLALQKLRRIL